MMLAVIALFLLLMAMAIFWYLDHSYMRTVLNSYIVAEDGERKLKESYRRSYEDCKVRIEHLQQEKADLAFKTSQEMATLKAKVKTIARELDEMVK